MTQAEAILDRLFHGETVTPIDALRDVGCFRLAARIEELRASGHDIETLRIDLPGGKMCAGYRLRRKLGDDMDTKTDLICGKCGRKIWRQEDGGTLVDSYRSGNHTNCSVSVEFDRESREKMKGVQQ